jgi:large subunit ribosomal protein L9
MEVILLDDLDGVGTKGATVNVKPGFARNYLLPRRLAISAGTRAGFSTSRAPEPRPARLVAAARGRGAFE